MTHGRLALAFVVATVAVPAFAADTYAVDKDHTHVQFEFPHMGISWWRGLVGKATGTITVDRAGRKGTVDVTLDPKSISFAHDEMDNHAASDKWFNVEKYPTVTYKGTLVFKGDEPSAVDGQLTMLGVTRPVKLKVNAFKCIDHPYYKKEACGADAEGQLNRADFGLTKGAEGDAGIVKLRVQVEALKQ